MVVAAEKGVTVVTNVGTWDRMLRIIGGIVLAYIAWTMWPGTAATILAVVAAIALVTGLVGWCALYALFGISTVRKSAVRPS